MQNLYIFKEFKKKPKEDQNMNVTSCKRKYLSFSSFRSRFPPFCALPERQREIFTMLMWDTHGEESLVESMWCPDEPVKKSVVELSRRDDEKRAQRMLKSDGARRNWKRMRWIDRVRRVCRGESKRENTEETARGEHVVESLEESMMKEVGRARGGESRGEYDEETAWEKCAVGSLEDSNEESI